MKRRPALRSRRRPPAPVSAPPTRRKPRRRASVVGVIGEILITVGVITLLYVVWQLWVGDVIYGAERNADRPRALADVGAGVHAAVRPSADARPRSTPIPVDRPTPSSSPQPADGEQFGVMHIPRFGADYAVPMAGGITRAKHARPDRHRPLPRHHDAGRAPATSPSPRTARRGASRSTASPTCTSNDAIVIETQDGWYTYRFRTLEYVHARRGRGAAAGAAGDGRRRPARRT